MTTGRGKVLLVDDDAMVLRTHTRLLERAGFRVTTAEDGASALAILAEGAVMDVVISDVNMPGMDGNRLLRKIREQDPELPVVLLTGAPSLGSAIEAVEYGALRYLQKPTDAEELTRALDQAVSLRRLGRLRLQALSLMKEGEVSDRAEAEATFERGLDGLWLAAQPIVSVRRRQVVAYEALLRTREPAIPHPGIFLPLAERLGGGLRLGRAVRARAASLSAELGDEIDLFVNLDALDLLDEELYATQAPLTRRAPHIVLELTERAPLERITELGARMERLHGAGFRLAIDDLGAGYAGLSSLAKLDAEVAKIDMSLVRDVDTNKRKATLVQALTETCASLGQSVVVEGVETAGERDKLKELGCDLMQGFFFGRPLEHPALVADSVYG